MKVRCGYCSGYFSDTEEKCPNCGAANEHWVRGADGVPKTIEELRAFCQAKQMPLEKMRFFIGTDDRGARAFGIYRAENGDVVVYKNKADGTRAVRYRGKDEAYAVHELYQKLHAEVQNRRSAPSPSPAYARSASGRQGDKKRMLLWLAFGAAVLLLLSGTFGGDARRGYYLFGGDTYYHQGNDWYTYDGGWIPAPIVERSLTENAGDYYQGESYRDVYQADDFAQSGYGKDDTDGWNQSWDDGDWAMDDGSWDSGGTDWGSDW